MLDGKVLPGNEIPLLSDSGQHQVQVLMAECIPLFPNYANPVGLLETLKAAAPFDISPRVTYNLAWDVSSIAMLVQAGQVGDSNL